MTRMEGSKQFMHRQREFVQCRTCSLKRHVERGFNGFYVCGRANQHHRPRFSKSPGSVYRGGYTFLHSINQLCPSNCGHMFAQPKRKVSMKKLASNASVQMWRHQIVVKYDALVNKIIYKFIEVVQHLNNEMHLARMTTLNVQARCARISGTENQAKL